MGEAKTSKSKLAVHVRMLETIFDMIPIAVLVKDLDGNMLLGNKAVEEMLGYNKERIPSLRDVTLGLGNEAQLQQMGNDDQHIIDTGETIEREREMTFGNDRREWLKMVKGPIWGHDGKIAGFVATWEIVSDRKFAEQRLHESKEQYRKLIEGSVQGIMVLDVDRHLFINQTSADIFGYESPEEMMSLRANYDLIAPHDRERSQKFARARIAGEKVQSHIQVMGLKKDGTIITLDSIVGLTTWGGRPAIQVTYNDITNKIPAQEELTAHRLEAVGALAQGISREITDISSRILTPIAMAKLEAYAIGSERITICLTEAERVSEEAYDLVKQLMMLFKGGTLTRERVSVADLVMHCLPLVNGRDNVLPLAGRSKYKFKIVIDSDLPTIMADKQQIIQVLNSLFTNAADAMPFGGNIDISVEKFEMNSESKALVLPPGTYARISVKDHGAGVTEEALKRVFDPYYLTDKISAGTGLVTAFSIVRNHGGTITSRSKLTKGVRITVYLPV